MGWYLRKSVKMGPVRLNLSKRGLGVSTGVKGFRIGTGPRGPYVAGGRGGIYFRQSLRARSPRKVSVRVVNEVPATRVLAPPEQPQPYQSPPSAYGPQPAQPQAQAYSPPPAYHAPPPPPPAPHTYHAYRTATLAGVSAAQALGWLLMFADSASQSAAQAASGSATFGFAGNLGMLLWLGSMVAVAAIDWRGFISLRGRIPWWRLTSGQKFWLVCAYVFCFEIMVPIYLVGAWIDFWRKRAADAQQRPFHIARMEAEMGMTPATEGTCAACGKPLQAGAQFCSYCRAPVSPHPKVCPSCATVALPDAQWCPKCGAALPS